jgi:hypothetical protein
MTSLLLFSSVNTIISNYGYTIYYKVTICFGFRLSSGINKILINMTETALTPVSVIQKFHSTWILFWPQILFYFLRPEERIFQIIKFRKEDIYHRILNPQFLSIWKYRDKRLVWNQIIILKMKCNIQCCQLNVFLTSFFYFSFPCLHGDVERGDNRKFKLAWCSIIPIRFT